MKFLGLRIFIGILELVWFILTVPSLILLYFIITDGQAPFPVTITVIALLVGALLIGLLMLAFAQLLNVLISIEHNTANAAENTARIVERAIRIEGQTAPPSHQSAS
jgi:RsiW-degrading membrane proteinase PrsW (M82 family)